MEHDAQSIYRTITNGEEQTLNKQMIDSGISILFNILCTFWPNSILLQCLEKLISKFNTFSTLSILCGNPEQNFKYN